MNAILCYDNQLSTQGSSAETTTLVVSGSGEFCDWPGDITTRLYAISLKTDTETLKPRLYRYPENINS